MLRFFEKQVKKIERIRSVSELQTMLLVSIKRTDSNVGPIMLKVKDDKTRKIYIKTKSDNLKVKNRIKNLLGADEAIWIFEKEI